LNIAAGPQMLAYTSQGQLHARSYDGALDLTVESGVAALYDVWLRANSFLLFLQF
jgi:hypothetical protein